MTSVSGSVSLICLSTVSPSASGRPIVEQHEIDAVAMLRDRVGGGAGLERAIALLLEAVDERPANQRLVVDDQDCGFRHASMR